MASEATLEQAVGVYVTDGDPGTWLTEQGSMARFAALQGLWLRQANKYTLCETPVLPPSLRRGSLCGVRSRIV